MHGGVLVKEGRSGGDELYAGAEGVPEGEVVVYRIEVTCDSKRYNVGLGCYVGNTCFCFHPGMRGAMFRIEGRGGFGNEDVGWTPPPHRSDGEPGTLFTIELSRTGRHQVTLTHPSTRETYTRSWDDTELWKSDAPQSPSFGLYAGDIRSYGNVFCTYYSVASRPGGESSKRQRISSSSTSKEAVPELSSD